MSIESNDFAYKISTIISESIVQINEENNMQTSREMEWRFILPKGCKIKADIAKGGGSITFIPTK